MEFSVHGCLFEDGRLHASTTRMATDGIARRWGSTGCMFA
jgi:hypothetical protein